uniref:Ovule protein n=1 Tax=Ascaris lumbricoides TaxID=6252 RepID=A0A0M3IWH9_ASCLU
MLSHMRLVMLWDSGIRIKDPIENDIYRSIGKMYSKKRPHHLCHLEACCKHLEFNRSFLNSHLYNPYSFFFLENHMQIAAAINLTLVCFRSTIVISNLIYFLRFTAILFSITKMLYSGIDSFSLSYSIALHLLFLGYHS